MAQVNLSEYIATLKLAPHDKNDGTWYARSVVQHDNQNYQPGVKLPDDLTNGQVAQLLEVNALTSVAPAKAEEAPAAGGEGEGGDGAPKTDENGNPIE